MITAISTTFDKTGDIIKHTGTGLVNIAKAFEMLTEVSLPLADLAKKTTEYAVENANMSFEEKKIEHKKKLKQLAASK